MTAFKAPDGKDNPQAQEHIKAIAKELGLGQVAAQKLFDEHLKAQEAGEKSVHDKMAETIKTTRAAWVQDAKNDSEIGGEKFAENLAKAQAAMKAAGNEKLATLLDLSGLGDHPEIIRHFVKIAPLFAQDTHVQASRPVTALEKTAKILYPNQR